MMMAASWQVKFGHIVLRDEAQGHPEEWTGVTSQGSDAASVDQVYSG